VLTIFNDKSLGNREALRTNCSDFLAYKTPNLTQSSQVE